jgi:hypothetical protein
VAGGVMESVFPNPNLGRNHNPNQHARQEDYDKD